MARRMGRFEDVRAILPKMINSLGMKKEYKARLIVFYWEKIVGRDIAAHVRPVRMSFRTLLLSTTDSTWANQLMLMQLDIIDKINHFIGENLVKEIRFCNAWQEPSAEEDEKDPEPDLGSFLRRMQLDAAEQQQAEAKCAEVQDDKLRGALRRLCQKQKKLEKLEKQYKWHACASCGALCPPQEVYCTTCAREERHRTEAKVRQILMDMPWARYGDVHAYVPCTAEMVNNQRVRLLQTLAARVPQGDTTSLDAKTLVMLYASIPPQQLTPEKIGRTLYRLRNDLRRTQAFQPRRRYESRQGHFVVSGRTKTSQRPGPSADAGTSRMK